MHPFLFGLSEMKSVETVSSTECRISSIGWLIGLLWWGMLKVITAVEKRLINKQSTMEICNSNILAYSILTSCQLHWSWCGLVDEAQGIKISCITYANSAEDIIVSH